MLRKLYSMLLRKDKEMSTPTDRRNQALKKHWLDVSLGRKKSFLPLPPEAEFEKTIEGVKDLREELNGIHKKLSILEDGTLYKSCPSGNDFLHPQFPPNVT